MSWADIIACPRCRAAARHSCVDTTGKRRATPHRDRAIAARDAGHAPRRGRPRELEGGEQAARNLRLSADDMRAIQRYRELHPSAPSDAAAIRAILAEWLEAQG